jgi:catechol 2,3-dioxygenase-like lactoylglutathione lyase family enzyme
MRLDHIAYRVANRDKTAEFFMRAFGYKLQAEFEIFFNDKKTEKAMCIALEPPEKTFDELPWTHQVQRDSGLVEYHIAPEIFVSEWVKKRDGIGGIHHIAYKVENVDAKMKEWTEKGFADFTTSKALRYDNLTQVVKEYLGTGKIAKLFNVAPRSLLSVARLWG